MNIFNNFCEFIFSSWLWGATMSWAQLFFSLGAFAMMIHYLLNKRWVIAFFQSLVLQLLSFWLFTLMVIGVIVHICGWKYIGISPTAPLQQTALFQMCMSLAILYATINTILLVLYKLFIRISIRWYIVCAWLSHLIGGLLGYSWIILFLWHLL